MRGKSHKARWSKLRGKISPFAKKKRRKSHAEASTSQKKTKPKGHHDTSSQKEIVKNNPKDVKVHAKDNKINEAKLKEKDVKAKDNDAKVPVKTTEDKIKVNDAKPQAKIQVNEAKPQDKTQVNDAKPQDKIQVDEFVRIIGSASLRKFSTPEFQQPSSPKKNSLDNALSAIQVKQTNLEESRSDENSIPSKSKKSEKAGSIGSFEDFDKVFASRIEAAAPKPILKPMSVTEIAYRKTSASSKISRKSTGSKKSGTSKSGGSKSSKRKVSTTLEILDLSSKKLLAVFSSIDYVWLEHSKYHTGSTPPNPYEYDVYSGLQQRILYIMPLFRKDESNVEVKRGLGFASTSYVIPPEFSCLTPGGEDMFHITCEVIQKCWGKPRINMDVIVKGNPLGKITQKRKDISIRNRQGEEMVIIKDVPMPSKWVCSETSRPFTCKILKPEQARDPSVIGVIGRNGPDTKAVIFGQPLGFYFHLKGTGKESKRKINLDIASRVCLISALVGLMTTYVNRKQ